MKLTFQEKQALVTMIGKTSTHMLEKYQKIDNSDKEILFLGDSIVEYLDTNFYFPEKKISNRGVAGATSKFVIDNLDKIVGQINPQKIFLSVGSNDLVLLENNPNEAADSIIELIERLRYKYPFATIYYLSTTPVVSEESKIYKKIYVAGRQNEDNKKINIMVQNYATVDNLIFINQYDSLLDNHSFLKEELTPDGIHLNKNGYDIYVRNIKKHLENICE